LSPSTALLPIACAALAFAVSANHPPVVLANSSYTVQQGGTLSVGPPGPLGNVTDPDGNAVYMDVNSAPTSGTLVSGSDGSFVYTTSVGFAGLTGFPFMAKDRFGGSALGAVTINVTGAPGRRPVAD
jgi:large repetitive protein